MPQIIILMLICLTIANVKGQRSYDLTDRNVEALNNYVHFINESVHGVHVVNKLLDIYNQNINKAAGLESTFVNNYSNADLPANIFESTWFFEPTPYQWIERAKVQSQRLDPMVAKDLNEQVETIKSILNKLNRIRFDLEHISDGVDLKVKEEAIKVYKKMEEAVELHDQFYEKQLKLEHSLSDYYNMLNIQATEDKDLDKIFKDLSIAYAVTRSMLKAIRSKNIDEFGILLNNLEEINKKIQRIKIKELSAKHEQIDKIEQAWSMLMEKLKNFEKSAVRFYEYGEVSSEYKAFDKFYYFHNFEILGSFNRYGSGIVSQINLLMDYMDINSLRFTEHPHYFQVIYPKFIEDSELIVSSAPIINNLPASLKERNIKTNKEVIRADSIVMELFLFDHLIEDGDVVSINFNGDWILENEMLEKSPKTLKLKLNEVGRNFIILHADSVGSRTPNTMGIKYTYKGNKKQIIMRSDLNTSELIEIVLVQ